MPILSAENRFKQGLAALVEERHPEAMHCFRAALDIHRERDTQPPEPRYLSYYGLSLARVQGASKRAIHACEEAARREPINPILLLNLGRVYVMAGRLGRALACFECALQIAPEHPTLRRELARVDRRSPPTVPSLDRSHPLNRWFGTWRARWRAGMGRREARAT